MGDSQEIVRGLREIATDILDYHLGSFPNGEPRSIAWRDQINAAASALEASERRCAELEAEIVAFRALVKDNSNMHDDALAREYQRGYQAGERDAYQ